jgi:hypothetical protein
MADIELGNGTDGQVIKSDGAGSAAWESLAKADVGLSNVDNTADSAKPISTLTQAALDLKVPTSRTINGSDLSANRTFTQDDFADGTTNKAYTATEKTKLAGIATAATANSADATLLDRANHTGTQLASTISDFAATVRGTILTGLAAGTADAITAANTVIEALANLQAQIDGVTTGLGGSTGATDNAILRANGTGGATAQSSGATIDDSGFLAVTTTGVYTSPNIHSISDSDTGVSLFGSNAIAFINGGACGMGVAATETNAGSAFQYGWTANLSGFGGGIDTGLARGAAKFAKPTDGSTGAGGFQLAEMTGPSAPAANSVYIFAEDNGSGKTRIMAQFATGSAVEIATEP